MKPTQIECIHYCTGAPVDQMEYLFKTFAIQGLLLETDIYQLASIGLPVFKMFADHFGCDLSDIKPMARDFVIRHDDFVSVINKLTLPGGLMYLEDKPKVFK